MHRSEINRAIDDARAFFARMGFPLPPFATWSPETWAAGDDACGEIRDVRLGWDVTDFGAGDFPRVGRTIFTLRNGTTRQPGYAKSYAQKVMCLAEGQHSPIHYHQRKMEDIINQGGGNIRITLWQATDDDRLSPADFPIQLDGVTRRITGGETLCLPPGASVCIAPRTYHQFWAEEATGTTLSMEVSSVCDDLTDNCWLTPMARFPTIVEDEPARYCLCSEYP